jgi:photosynthetic reaction center cytochrome c subunit
MNGRHTPAARIMLAGAIALGMATLTRPSSHAQNAASAVESKTTEQAFKNIKVLKGMPADELMPTMQFIGASLGVECSFCHVEGGFEKDDKKPKETARKMMEMVFAINKNTFEGRRGVTCNSCHRGSIRPVAIPAIMAEQPSATAGEGEPPTAEKAEQTEVALRAAANAILDKYLMAVGGADAIQKITSIVERGTVNAGGRQFPVDVYTKAPDKRTAVLHLPNGESITAFDGKNGWSINPGRPVSIMSRSESEAARLDADIYLAIRLKQIYDDFRVTAPEKIDEHGVNVVVGSSNGKPPVKLYFDQQTALLVRMVRYSDTLLGLNPMQIDYADYRESGGVRIPYRWIVARPLGRFTVQIERVQHNVPLDDARFSQPASAPGPS